MLNIIVPVFGLFVGSFLNLCIDRLPHGKSMNPFGSSCPARGKLITAYQRIPVLGYMFAKCNCMRCKTTISFRYPAIEVASGLILYLLFKKFGLSVEFVSRAFLVLLLILVSYIDLYYRAIPEILSVVGLAVGFIVAFFRRPFFFYQDALYGIFLCGGVLFAVAFFCYKVFRKEIMSFSDIILLSTIGAFCGLKGALFSLIAGSLLGALVGVAAMLLKGKSAAYAVPFGPFLSVGAFFFMTFGDRFVYVFVRLVSGAM